MFSDLPWHGKLLALALYIGIMAAIVYGLSWAVNLVPGGLLNFLAGLGLGLSGGWLLCERYGRR